ncbi:hypothetical protein Tco_0879670 [Tanacetum coccineum]
MTSLADKSLLSGGDNKPPMLEKHLYDSWKSRMELYMMNRPHGRMILASVEKGPLVWPSITEDGVTRLKEYVELTPAEAIQADCDNTVNKALTTELDRYKEEIKDLKEKQMQNVENSFSGSNKQYAEIELGYTVTIMMAEQTKKLHKKKTKSETGQNHDQILFRGLLSFLVKPQKRKDEI